jgi:hypothetical protein
MPPSFTMLERGSHRIMRPIIDALKQAGRRIKTGGQVDCTCPKQGENEIGGETLRSGILGKTSATEEAIRIREPQR